MTFANDIKSAREKMGLSQEAAAREIRKLYGVRLSSAYLSIIERGERVNLTTKLDQALRDFFKLITEPAVQAYYRLPVLGTIQSGGSLLAQKSYEGYLAVPDYLRSDFVFKVVGDDMMGAGILNGDYVVCRESCIAENGQIVVALKDLDTGFYEATLKYYFDNGNRRYLRAANPQISDLPLTGKYRITGVMEGLIRKGSPEYRQYRDYLKSGGSEGWSEVLEKAESYGITPQQLSTNLDMQWEMAKRIKTRE